ncbi:hypothetical protein [Paeniglutamicibacter sp. Y32M11]|uniref:hypothetical protein n=1 Tax=Paeniglutamicibacter sp. Y32M11 TaxID=2853258 RepID=UPI001C52BD0D|nr:hypothetical protein [Paeniglutamicibacter sp. Y32M11]QXQ11812.1 hypothetical protein KUF55_08050 [Paeniglutamicibacter sp. Y32M11]
MDDSQTPPTPHQHSPRRRLPALAGIIAVVALVAGLVTLWTTRGKEVDFGFVGYAPLSDTTFLSGLYFLAPAEIAGYLLLAIACCAAAFWAGLRLGKRQR